MSEPNPADEPSRNSRLILVALVFAFALGLDLWTKAWVWNNLRGEEPVEVIKGFFYLKYGFNTGAAFSFLRDASWARAFFISVTLLALGYMGWLAWKMPTKRGYGFVAIGMIAAGASGNLHDRLVRVDRVPIKGEMVDSYGVVDFLQFYYPWNPEEYWPIFNVADSALVCGVALLLLFLHFHGEEGAEATEDEEETSDSEAEVASESASESESEADEPSQPSQPSEPVGDGATA